MYFLCIKERLLSSKTLLILVLYLKFIYSVLYLKFIFSYYMGIKDAYLWAHGNLLVSAVSLENDSLFHSKYTGRNIVIFVASKHPL